MTKVQVSCIVVNLRVQERLSLGYQKCRVREKEDYWESIYICKEKEKIIKLYASMTIDPK